MKVIYWRFKAFAFEGSSLNLYSHQRFAIAWRGIGLTGGRFFVKPRCPTPPPTPICKRPHFASHFWCFEVWNLLRPHLKTACCSSAEKIFIAFLLTSMQRYSRISGEYRRFEVEWCWVRGKAGGLFKRRKTAGKRPEKRPKRPFLPSPQGSSHKRRIRTSAVVWVGWQKQNSQPMGKPLTGYGKSDGRGWKNWLTQCFIHRFEGRFGEGSTTDVKPLSEDLWENIESEGDSDIGKRVICLQWKGKQGLWGCATKVSSLCNSWIIWIMGEVFYSYESS